MVGKGADVGLGFASGVAVASLPENTDSAREEVRPFAGNLLAIVVPAVVIDALHDINESAQAESIVRGGIAVGGAAVGKW